MSSFYSLDREEFWRGFIRNCPRINNVGAIGVGEFSYLLNELTSVPNRRVYKDLSLPSLFLAVLPDKQDLHNHLETAIIFSSQLDPVATNYARVAAKFINSCENSSLFYKFVAMEVVLASAEINSVSERDLKNFIFATIAQDLLRFPWIKLQLGESWQHNLSGQLQLTQGV